MSRSNETTTLVNKLVGANIMSERLARGLSRQQLGVIIEVTHQQLQKYERGTNRVTAGRLYLIAKALNRPIEWFFNGEDSISLQPEEETVHHRMSIEVARNFLRIPNPVHQNAVNKLVLSLTESD